MSYPNPTNIRHVALIGTGLIGAGWAALFLARGLAVHAIDPAPGAEDRLRKTVSEMWPSLVGLGQAEGEPDHTRLSFATIPGSALSDAELVQESAPEKLELKRALLAKVEGLVSESAVIASSTSALLVGDIQKECRKPQRVIAAHPFNPPHILPLVEVSGGPATDPAALDWAMAFYAWLGKKPVRLGRQVEGHIAGRLSAALWREAVSLVEQGVATVADIDAAVRHGPGPRWATTGCHLTYHLGGGTGGLAHYLAHLGPSQQRRWDDLGTPRLTPALCQKLAEGVEAETEGADIAALVEERDRRLMALLQALSGKADQKRPSR
ncbi:3-hydroxyacyl-CoA dehydrogenase NAD-binding domain-containing protein [uncultured Jannaschia sp.]|uniref:3-hydroxyacyl-CoA dehydrogenase NAD-binding domain-containing protein n=1 Tax=uncultured Jannaschia sp. TaxID=293347 RepID=UPI002625FC9D|nr:3-hydroxyacyl-CoA dehydrogenase NAD-binding domain-containing protein [uncultured Jannaschia sp.]